MKKEEISRIVREFRENVCSIDDKEVEEVLSSCRRKISIIGKAEEYMEFLLPDELKNYCIRRAINATTALRKLEKEGLICVQCVGTTHV